MAVREIRLLGDPILRQECEPVERVDGEVRRLVDDLMETMYEAEGIGLAAPQVGVPLRVFVYDVRDPEAPSGALINPQIVASSGSDREEEGCLSIPGVSGVVERSASVVVEALDADGERVRVEADGLLSRCLQHERDHLDGILFLDHLSPLKRDLLLKKWKKRMEEEAQDAAGSGAGAL